MVKVGGLFILLMVYWSAFADNDDVKKVSRMIESVGEKYAPDKRTAVFEISIIENTQQIIVKGKTNLPQARQLILDSLSFFKINYVDSVTVLPDQSVGDLTWGIVTLSVANIRTKPDHAAELASQALMGTPVKVLEIKDGWRQIQTPDNYIGWVDENAIVLKTAADMDLWRQSKRAVFNKINGNVVNIPKSKASPVSDLVLGDLFEISAEKKGFLKMIFPDGRTGFVKSKDCIPYEKWIAQKPTAEAVLSIAKQLLGTTYLWGGTSCKAVDCSGMIKTAWFSQAIILARDASQQIRYGERIDYGNIDNLTQGDLLFFGRNVQRITHVGIYLKEGKYIHASGLVRINSINPKDSQYNVTEKKNLVGAIRITNSIGTEGIVPVKNHPWYKMSGENAN